MAALARLMMLVVLALARGSALEEAEQLEGELGRLLARGDASFQELAMLGSRMRQLAEHGAAPARVRGIAAQALSEALLISGDVPLEARDIVRFALADLHASLSEPERALRVLDAIRQDAGDAQRDAVVLQHRSLVLRSLGRRAEALQDLLAAVRTAEHLTPRMASALAGWSPEEFDEYRPPGSDVAYADVVSLFEDAAEGLLPGHGGETEEEVEEAAIHLFALFEIADREARATVEGPPREQAASRAWRWLERGNELAGRVAAWDAEEDSRQHKLMAQIFSRDALEWLASHGVGYRGGSGRVIFVVGMPRSGSTLLEQVLSAHSQVTGLGEESEVTFLLHGFHSELIRAYSGSSLDVQSLRAWLDHNVPKALDAMARRPENRGLNNVVFVDKMLAHYMHLGLIRAVLPDAKVLHIFRRTREDAVLSLFRRLFPRRTAPWSYSVTDIERHLEAYEALMAHWRTALPRSVLLDLAYEDLVAAPEKVVRQVARFCDLPWEPQVLDFHALDKNRKRAVLTQSADQVREGIHSRGVGASLLYRRWLAVQEQERDEL